MLDADWWVKDTRVAAMLHRLGLQTTEQHLDGDAFVNQAAGKGTIAVGNAGAQMAPCGPGK